METLFTQIKIPFLSIGIDVLEYLKYGTLGLAGIILLLAFFLYRQAHELPEPARMQNAQNGVQSYMTVAKWLLIPCMLLQVLDLLLVKSSGELKPVTDPEPVTVNLRIPPLRDEQSTKLGSARIRILNNGDNPDSVFSGDEIGKNVTLADGAHVVVDIRKVTDRLAAKLAEEIPKSSALDPTPLN